MGIITFAQHNAPRKQENARKKKRKRKGGSGEEARANIKEFLMNYSGNTKDFLGNTQ